MRVARYYCPRAHETFSLLPDCLASPFPSELDELERVTIQVATHRSVEAAADVLRPEITLPSAVRWIRRCLTLVRTSLVLVTGLLGLDEGPATLGAFRAACALPQNPQSGRPANQLRILAANTAFVWESAACTATSSTPISALHCRWCRLRRATCFSPRFVSTHPCRNSPWLPRRTTRGSASATPAPARWA
jgi:hypothetical protein